MPIGLRVFLWICGGAIVLTILYIVSVAILVSGSINSWFSPYKEVIESHSAELPDPATIVFEGVSLKSPLANIDPGFLGLGTRYDPTVGPVFSHSYCYGVVWPSRRAPTTDEWHQTKDNSIVRFCVENPYSRDLETRFNENVDSISRRFDTVAVSGLGAVPGDEATGSALALLAGTGDVRVFAHRLEGGSERYELYSFSESRLGIYMTHCRQRIIDTHWLCDVYVPVDLGDKSFHLRVDLGYELRTWQDWERAAEHGMDFVQRAAGNAASVE